MHTPPIWLLEGYRRIGTSDAMLLTMFRSLDAQALTDAWAYVDAHVEEVSRELDAHVSGRWPPHGSRPPTEKSP